MSAAGAATEPLPGWLRVAPTIGVVNDAELPPPLMSLLGLVRRWSRVVVTTADVREPMDAFVVGHPRLLGRRVGRSAVWVDDLSQLGEVAGRAEIVLSDQSEVVAAAGARGLLVPGRPLGAPGVGAVWVPPAVRERLRRARGLPETLVIEREGTGWVTPAGSRIAPDLAGTALACASVAIMTGESVMDGLAWGTPVVTDGASSAAVGATDELATAESADQRRRLALGVAHDPRRCARLSWSGRVLFERCHAPDLVAGALVRRLGLGSGGRIPGPVPLTAALAELHTPGRATIAERVAVATFGHSVPTD